MFQLIPAIDIIDGKLVRLYQGDYDQQTAYQTSPKDMAFNYKQMGCNHIHVVDLNGAVDGALTNLNVIKDIANIPDITIQVGGGIRTLSHAQQLFDCGVSNIIIGSLLMNDRALATNIIQSFPHKVIAGLDVKDNAVAIHGWKDTASQTLEEVLSDLNTLPIASIISTDISRDGTFDGVNTELYQRISKTTEHKVIASGGVDSIENVLNLKHLQIPGMVGCIVGKAVIEGKITASDIKRLHT
jgi:phosphoribosylformimino-5-aminoimidazole carboxamide ribotide isomerase